MLSSASSFHNDRPGLPLLLYVRPHDESLLHFAWEQIHGTSTKDDPFSGRSAELCPTRDGHG